MTKLIIVRHACSKANIERSFAGQTDVPLVDIGYKQAERVSEYLVKNFKIDKIYSSDLSRVINTIKPAADALSLPINKSISLREIDVGEWAGMFIDEVAEKYPNEYHSYAFNRDIKCGVTGESYNELISRATLEIKRIAEENDGKTVLVGSHGGFIRALLFGLGYFEKITDAVIVGNTSVTVMEYDNGNINFVSVNRNDHLGDFS